jgi:hypothetical protein
MKVLCKGRHLLKQRESLFVFARSPFVREIILLRRHEKALIELRRWAVSHSHGKGPARRRALSFRGQDGGDNIVTHIRLDLVLDWCLLYYSLMRLASLLFAVLSDIRETLGGANYSTVSLISHTRSYSSCCVVATQRRLIQGWPEEEC